MSNLLLPFILEKKLSSIMVPLSLRAKSTHPCLPPHNISRKLDHSFSFPFQIEVNMCNITQKSEHFELKINNQSFDQLYQHRKTPQRAIAYLKTSLEITNPIQETQYKPTVKVDPTQDPRARTTQVLLEAEGGKPGFQDALNKLKGNRPAVEQQNQKNAAAKP